MTLATAPSAAAANTASCLRLSANCVSDRPAATIWVPSKREKPHRPQDDQQGESALAVGHGRDNSGATTMSGQRGASLAGERQAEPDQQREGPAHANGDTQTPGGRQYSIARRATPPISSVSAGGGSAANGMPW